jgi:phage FluMu protein Com
LRVGAGLSIMEAARRGQVLLARGRGTAQFPGMLQGPDVVLACPHCKTLARLFTVATPDPTGSLSWSDGYQEMPMTPAQPNISRCRGCGKLMWSAECAPVGMIDENQPSTPEQEEWKKLPYLEPAGEADYLEALKTGMAVHPEQETELRVFAWWRANDRHRREQGTGRYPQTPEAIENLEKLVELLKDGEHEFILFRAEALRQLGRFEEASEMLHGICSDYALARERMCELIEQKSRDVEVLFA